MPQYYYSYVCYKTLYQLNIRGQMNAESEKIEQQVKEESQNDSLDYLLKPSSSKKHQQEQIKQVQICISTEAINIQKESEDFIHKCNQIHQDPNFLQSKASYQQIETHHFDPSINHTNRSNLEQNDQYQCIIFQKTDKISLQSVELSINLQNQNNRVSQQIQKANEKDFSDQDSLQNRKTIFARVKRQIFWKNLDKRRQSILQRDCHRERHISLQRVVVEKGKKSHYFGKNSKQKQGKQEEEFCSQHVERISIFLCHQLLRMVE